MVVSEYRVSSVYKIFSKDSERREPWQTKTQFSSLTRPSRLLSSTKIRKRREPWQTKTQFSSLTRPSRLLSSTKIRKRREPWQTKTQFSSGAIPSRLLSYSKIVKDENRDKRNFQKPPVIPLRPDATDRRICDAQNKYRATRSGQTGQYNPPPSGTTSGPAGCTCSP